jgi:acetolactate decarboxylase
MKEFNLTKQVLFIFLPFLLFSASHAQTSNNVFQYSVLPALQSGNFEGDYSIKELIKHGNFGLGTLNHVDGELVAVDGIFYRVSEKGEANIIPGDSLTPYAVVTFFEPDESGKIEGSFSYNELHSKLDSVIPALNSIYAIRIEGTFAYMKTRSIPPQQKPYKRLEEVLKTQPVFELENIKGTMVGYRFPPYVKEVNQPGYHFHFITEDKKSGGHVLELKIADVNVEYARQNSLQIFLPRNKDFMEINFPE